MLIAHIGTAPHQNAPLMERERHNIQSTTREANPNRPGVDTVSHNYDVSFVGDLQVSGLDAQNTSTPPANGFLGTQYVFDNSAQTISLSATYVGQNVRSIASTSPTPSANPDQVMFNRYTDLQYQLDQIAVNTNGSVQIDGYDNEFDFTLRSVDPTNIVNNSTALAGGFNGHTNNGGLVFGSISGSANLLAQPNWIYTENTIPGYEGTGWVSPFALQYNDIVATISTTLDETGLVTPTVTVTDGIEMNGSQITGLADGVLATDAVNKGQLDAEAAARVAADTALAASITQEATTRAAADTALAAAITAETSARTAADTQLSAAVTSEATTRAAADTAINQRIDTETAARTALAGAITAETTARMAADTQLGNRMTALEDRLDNYDAALNGFDKKIDGATSVAIAMGGTTFLPDMKFNLSTNVGHYGGEQAGSVSFGALVTPHVAINGGIAKGFSKKGKTGARAGVTFGW